MCYKELMEKYERKSDSSFSDISQGNFSNYEVEDEQSEEGKPTQDQETYNSNNQSKDEHCAPSLEEATEKVKEEPAPRYQIYQRPDRGKYDHYVKRGWRKPAVKYVRKVDHDLAHNDEKDVEEENKYEPAVTQISEPKARGYDQNHQPEVEAPEADTDTKPDTTTERTRVNRGRYRRRAQFIRRDANYTNDREYNERHYNDYNRRGRYRYNNRNDYNEGEHEEERSEHTQPRNRFNTFGRHNRRQNYGRGYKNARRYNNRRGQGRYSYNTPNRDIAPEEQSHKEDKKESELRAGAMPFVPQEKAKTSTQPNTSPKPDALDSATGSIWDEVQDVQDMSYPSGAYTVPYASSNQVINVIDEVTPARGSYSSRRARGRGRTRY